MNYLGVGENASNVFLASLLIKTIKIFLCQLSAPFLSPKELAAFKIGNSFVDYVREQWTLNLCQVANIQIGFFLISQYEI